MCIKRWPSRPSLQREAHWTCKLYMPQYRGTPGPKTGSGGGVGMADFWDSIENVKEINTHPPKRKCAPPLPSAELFFILTMLHSSPVWFSLLLLDLWQNPEDLIFHLISFLFSRMPSNGNYIADQLCKLASISQELVAIKNSVLPTGLNWPFSVTSQGLKWRNCYTNLSLNP